MIKSESIQDNRSRFLFTFKAWPVITFVTIGLCFLTQQVAKLFGIELPDQANLELVRKCLGWNWRFAFLALQVLIVMPALEEVLFRGVLFKWPEPKRLWLPAVTSSVLFSAAHYIAQPFPDAAFVALAFFGLAQCWLYHKTDSILSPMINHALFNLTNLILLFFIHE